MENNKYKEMYLKLFNAMSDAIEKLQEAQKEVEKMYIEAEDGEN